MCVGGSMQDISRDELCLLSSSGCDKELSAAASLTNDSTDRHKLPRTPDLEPSVIIKLEDADITYPWSVSDIGSNLLRHSDDPLLSGATDQNEFTSLHKTPSTSINSSASKRNLLAATNSNNMAGNFTKKLSAPNAPRPRTRKKGQFKLRFHHQALPQEYLDHYEASQRNENAGDGDSRGQLKVGGGFSSVMDTPESPQDRTNENIRNWLQKISELQSEGISLTPTTLEDCVHMPSTPKTPLTPSSPKMCTGMDLELLEKGVKAAVAPTASPSTSKVVNYNDLPFMGEMTLENSKPRRGRKPKKADICHLIYKNYGTIFPGTPLELVDTNTTIPVASKSAAAKKVDIQNKIITSLLEKRLTIKGEPAGSEAKPTEQGGSGQGAKKKSDEPLNLCVRDRSGIDSVTVSSDEDASHNRNGVHHLTESVIKNCIENSVDHESLVKNLKMILPNFHAKLQEKSLVEVETLLPKPIVLESLPQSSTSGDNAGLVYWPERNIYINPMALYYQKMFDANMAESSLRSKERSLPPTTSNIIPAKGLVAKNINQLTKPNLILQVPSRPETASSVSSSNSKGTAAALHNQPPQKRKRSAIFIPPMPETANSASTEVSICKFKFTGGAKPSLQEKKMLSVDSGGNFRYYSGTGDKSMRGYEFFPRESLQQSALVAGSSAGAFLNAHGEKIPMEAVPPPSPLPLPAVPAMSISPLELLSEHSTATQSSNQSLNVGGAVNFAQMPSCPNASSVTMTQLLAHVGKMQQQQQQQLQQHQSPHTLAQQNVHNLSLDRRKRKSRRSIQREKLEKTFKEKGFLIQTQQTESAEGATYCKFRQLKKFTRYLFRSWKNYLPGDLQQQQQLQAQHQQQESMSKP